MSQDGTVPALIALVIFIVLTGVFGWQSYNAYQDVYRSTAEVSDELIYISKGRLRPGQAETPGLMQEYYEELLQLRQAKLELEVLEEELDAQQEIKDELEYRRQVIQQDINRVTRDMQWFGVRANANAQQVEAIGADGGEEVQFEFRGGVPSVSDRYEGVTPFGQRVRMLTIQQAVGRIKTAAKMERERQRNELDEKFNQINQKLRNEILEVESELDVERERYSKLVAAHRDEISRVKTMYDNAKDELERITRRERIVADVEPDGRIVDVDLEHRLAVINIGGSHDVKPGFRFEVFQMKGGRRVHKGWLEVREIQPETATCIVLKKTVALPTCPVTSYVAKQPEERFSPYVRHGAEGRRVQPLNGKPKVLDWGLNLDDPMVRGDLVWNPFYDTDKTLHFTIQGAESIKYRPDEMAIVIRRYGGVVDQDLTPQTDFLIATKWSQDYVKQARELGVKVFYEFELFRFLSPDLL